MCDKTVRLGSGSSHASSLPDMAYTMAREVDIDYLCCDRLAERTLANATLKRKNNESPGYNPSLKSWFEKVLPICVENNITVIGSFGAANPDGAADKVRELATDLGINGVRIAAVMGDNVLKTIENTNDPLESLDTNEELYVDELPNEVISANAYLGASPIVSALQQEAEIVLTGRVADASLFVAPLMYEFGWDDTDVDKLASGTAVGHLLECGARATGGTMAYPGYHEVPDNYDLGLPFADVYEDGRAQVSKPPETGGVVSELTTSAQLCWEIHDPENYKTPDVIANFSDISLMEVRDDVVEVVGAKGKPRPEELKVLIGVHGGYIADIEKIWAGVDAMERAEYTIENIIREKIDKFSEQIVEYTVDKVGVNAVFGESAADISYDPNEVAVRVAAKFRQREEAERFFRVMGTYMGRGGIGAGGFRRDIQEFVELYPTVIDRSSVNPNVQIKKVKL